MTTKGKVLIQENIKKIQMGNFSENDIGMLYMELRQLVNPEASPYENAVYELSNFFAHYDKRNKGVLIVNFADFYYASLFISFYLTNTSINLTTTFPSVIKDICVNKLNKMEDKIVKNIFGDDKDIVKRFIEKAIICDTSKKEATIDKSAPKIIYEIISTLINKITTEPIFTGDSIIKSLLKVLDINNIHYDKNALLKQKDKIILSLLVFIHHTDFENKLGIKIHCHIYYDIYTNNLSLNMGYLLPANECFGFMYEVITTDLNMNDYCSDSLLRKHHIDLQEKNGSVFNAELGLNNDFKLEEKTA